ncbi:MAG: ABC transporter substrate-binding protein [Peptococcales bacterium]|jgi:iron complex transport system substrate-binding protein
MREIKKVILLILACTLILLTFGCNQERITSKNGNANIFVDSLERKVAINDSPGKVISLAPAITEILFALDQGDKVVGVTDYCDYPEEALNKPKIGDFENPNLELIVSAQPDIILVASGIQTDLISKFEELNIPVFCLDARTIDQILSNIKMVGQIMDAEEKALEITQTMEAKIENIQEKVKNQENPLVFFEVWDSPLMSAGPGTFIDDMIALAGGINFAKDQKSEFPQINFETLVEANPDVYIAIAHQKQDQIADRPNYEALKAVQNNRIYTVEDDLVTLPGPRIVNGLEEIAKAIHPELFE